MTATQLTVSDAALQVGVTRQTIFKAIKSGKLSATQNNRGHMQINIVELLRVYGELQSPEQVAKNKVHREQQSPALPASAGLQLELERMKLLIERKDFELEQMREKVADLKIREQQATEERLRLFGIVERQTLLLSAPASARAAKVRVAASAKKPVQAHKTVAKKATAKPLAKAPTRSARSKPAAAAKKPVAKTASSRDTSRSIAKKGR